MLTEELDELEELDETEELLLDELLTELLDEDCELLELDETDELLDELAPPQRAPESSGISAPPF